MGWNIVKRNAGSLIDDVRRDIAINFMLTWHKLYIYIYIYIIYIYTHLRAKQDRKQLVNEYFVAGCPQQRVKPITVVPISERIHALTTT